MIIRIVSTGVGGNVDTRARLNNSMFIFINAVQNDVNLLFKIRKFIVLPVTRLGKIVVPIAFIQLSSTYSLIFTTLVYYLERRMFRERGKVHRRKF